MKTGGILLRVSSARQAEVDKTSYAVQLAQCLAYAAAHDIDVPKDLIWQEIGQRDQYYPRDGLQAALRAAEQDKYQTLIVWRLDRLTDSYKNFVRIWSRLEACHVELWSATEPDVDLTTPHSDWYVHTKLHFQVEPERTTFATRVNENRKLKLKQGLPWAASRTRYGYRWIQDPERMVRRYEQMVYLKERLEPDPATAPVVQQVYQWADEGKTLNWIAKALSGLELDARWHRPTPYEHSHTSGANLRGFWDTASVTEILKFTGYHGRWPALRTKREPRNDGTERYKQTRIKEDKWEWIEPSPAPVLVTREQWERVQMRLRTNKISSPRTHDENGKPVRKIEVDQALLYGGMARCGVIHEDGQMCGHRVEPRPRGKIYTRKDGTRPIQYRCASAKRTRGSCRGVFVEGTLLDNAVIAALAATLTHPDNIARLARRSHEEALVKSGDLKVTTPINEYRTLQKRLAKEAGRLEHLQELSADPELNDLTRHGYKMAVMRQMAETQTLEEDCERARKAAAQYKHVEEVVADLEHYLKQWDLQTELLVLGGYTRKTLRKCLEALGALVIVHPYSDVPTQPIATLQLHLTRLDFGAKCDDEHGVVDVPVLPASPRSQRPSKTVP